MSKEKYEDYDIMGEVPALEEIRPSVPRETDATGYANHMASLKEQDRDELLSNKMEIERLVQRNKFLERRIEARAAQIVEAFKPQFKHTRFYIPEEL